MAELMKSLGDLQNKITQAHGEQLKEDDELHKVLIEIIKLEEQEKEIQHLRDEEHKLVDDERQKNKELSAAIAAKEAEFRTCTVELTHINQQIGDLSGSIGGPSGAQFHGQEKLAQDMGDWETLSAVLPHLDEEIQDGTQQSYCVQPRPAY